MPWFMATLDPLPTERGQGSNCILMDTNLVLNLQSHNGNTTFTFYSSFQSLVLQEKWVWPNTRPLLNCSPYVLQVYFSTESSPHSRQHMYLYFTIIPLFHHCKKKKHYFLLYTSNFLFFRKSENTHTHTDSKVFFNDFYFFHYSWFTVFCRLELESLNKPKQNTTPNQ